MINIIGVYNDVVLDDISESENGRVGIDRFNRYSRRAELKLLEYLTGDIEGIKPPEPYLTQKNKDFLAPLIKKYPAQVTGGKIDRPDDYHSYENFYKIGTHAKADCENDKQDISECNTPIVLLDGDVFNARCKTYIKESKPSFKAPIAKEIGLTFEVAPSDLGSVVLEYVRYPKFGEIVIKKDLQFNDEVPDDTKSTNYEWPESCRNLLIWFIVDQFTNHSREQAAKQFNTATGKTVR